MLLGANGVGRTEQMGGISGVSNAGHCRAVAAAALIRDLRISPRGVPPKTLRCKKITNAPRRHEAGTMFEVWRGTKDLL